jgi:hypothetical protein
MPRPIIRSLILLLAASAPAFAAPVIEGGIHYLLPNDQRTIPIMVSGGDLVEGINFYVQLGDGGPINGGTTTAPKISAIDLVGSGTLFSQSNTGSQAMCLPDSGGTYLIWGDWITTQPPNDKISAAGNLHVGGSDPCALTAGSIAVNKLTIGGASAFSQDTAGESSSVSEPTTVVLAIAAAMGMAVRSVRRSFRTD